MRGREPRSSESFGMTSGVGFAAVARRAGRVTIAQVRAERPVVGTKGVTVEGPRPSEDP